MLLLELDPCVRKQSAVSTLDVTGGSDGRALLFDRSESVTSRASK